MSKGYILVYYDRRSNPRSHQWVVEFIHNGVPGEQSPPKVDVLFSSICETRAWEYGMKESEERQCEGILVDEIGVAQAYYNWGYR
jgi:hypothetical protein